MDITTEELREESLSDKGHWRHKAMLVDCAIEIERLKREATEKDDRINRLKALRDDIQERDDAIERLRAALRLIKHHWEGIEAAPVSATYQEISRKWRAMYNDVERIANDALGADSAESPRGSEP